MACCPSTQSSLTQSQREQQQLSEGDSFAPQSPQQKKGYQIIEKKFGQIKLQKTLMIEEQLQGNFSNEDNYHPSHQCQSSSVDQNRCQICGGTLKLIFKYCKDLPLQKPYSITYVEYSKLFSKKMECFSIPSSFLKQYLQISYLPYLRQWVMIILDRPPFFSIDNISQNTLKYQNSQGSYQQSEFQTQNNPPIASSGPQQYQQTQSYSLSKRLKPLERQREFDSSFLKQCESQIKLDAESSQVEKENESRGQWNTNDQLSIFGNFEGANISCCAINKEKKKCQLILRSDTNTKGCLHWFMFTVKVGQFGNSSVANNYESDPEKLTVNFSILNNIRSSILYRQGMQIAVLDSTKLSKGWHRGGQNIYYYRSNVSHKFFQQKFREKESSLQQGLQQKQTFLLKSKRNFQSLDFSYTFSSPNSSVTFAYCFPYTLTHLVSFFHEIESKLLSKTQNRNSSQTEMNMKINTSSISYKRKTITSSRLNLPIFKISITSSTLHNYSKKAIYILARQHPGETPSSFVCQGVIKSLLADTPQAIFLRENYIFKIVPMMNPDGVVLGNSRCNLSGADLNRKWDNPDKILHPEVHEVKKRLIKTHAKREVIIFCDLHGHSAKKHSFFYGCNKISEGGTSSWTETHILPRIISRISPHFSLNDCKFRVTDDKKNTARVVVYSQIKVPNSFTFETSFFGYDDKKSDNKPTQFSIPDLEKLGSSLVSGFVEYSLLMEEIKAEVSESRGRLNLNKTKAEKNLSPSKVGSNFETAQNKIKKNIKQTLTSCKTNQDPQPVQMDRISLEEDKEVTNLKELENNKRKQEEGGEGGRVSSGIEKENQVTSIKLEKMILCPGLKSNWREYFEKDELEKVFKKIEKGEDPNDNESISGSDSEPEEDLYKPEEQVENTSENKNYCTPIKNNNTNNVNSSIQIKDNIQLRESRTSSQRRKKYLSIGEQKSLQARDAASKEKNVTLRKQPIKMISSSPTNEKMKWTPSPLIQSYKIQLEIKKQQFKKQSYPIAKVGQNFSSYKNSNYQTHTGGNGYNNSIPCINQSNQDEMSQINYSSSLINETKQASVIPALPKNGINASYLDKRITEIKQNQSEFQQSFASQQQQQWAHKGPQQVALNSMILPLTQITSIYRSPKIFQNYLDEKKTLNTSSKEGQSQLKNDLKEQSSNKELQNPTLPNKHLTISSLQSTYSALDEIVNQQQSNQMKDKIRSESVNNYVKYSYNIQIQKGPESQKEETQQSNEEKQKRNSSNFSSELLQKQQLKYLIANQEKNKRPQSSSLHQKSLNYKFDTTASATTNNNTDDINSTTPRIGLESSQLSLKKKVLSSLKVKEEFLAADAFAASSKKVALFYRLQKRRKESSEKQKFNQELHSSPSETVQRIEGNQLKKQQNSLLINNREQYQDSQTQKQAQQLDSSNQDAEIFTSSMVHMLSNTQYSLSSHKQNTKNKLKFQENANQREGEQRYRGNSIDLIGNKQQRKIRASSMIDGRAQNQQSPIWKLLCEQDQKCNSSEEQQIDFVPLSNISHRQSLSGNIVSNITRGRKQLP